MITGTPYHVTRSGLEVTVRFATAESSDIVTFTCADDVEAFDTTEMWYSLIFVAGQDPANNEEDPVDA